MREELSERCAILRFFGSETRGLGITLVGLGSTILSFGLSMHKHAKMPMMSRTTMAMFFTEAKCRLWILFLQYTNGDKEKEGQL